MPSPAESIDLFINRWTASAAAERANYQLFLSELCDLIEVPRPDPTGSDDADSAYVFERNVHFPEDDGSSSIGRIDLYRRGAFVLEAKQGSDAETAEQQAAAALQSATAKKATKRGTAVRGTKAWDDAMVRARGQADRYARALPVEEGWPPFLIVVDVGHSIELYSEFSDGVTQLQHRTLRRRTAGRSCIAIAARSSSRLHHPMAQTLADSIHRRLANAPHP